jgi:SAM-dependent methyltransferase
MTKTYSILRTKEDEELQKISLSGKVLDLGGHKDSSYFALLKTKANIEIANIDSTLPGTHHKSPSGAEHAFDFEQPFPLTTSSYDSVLCINVLEHIYNYRNLLNESYRVVKPGGTLYLSVPFFFNIHGSTDDYFRYTKSALERLLGDSGFSNIKIVELGDGPCSVMFQTFGGSIPTMALKLFFKHISMRIDSFFCKISARYASIKKKVPLGYFVSAQK